MFKLVLCLERYSYLSQNVNRILIPNGKILVRILSGNPHGTRKWVDGDSERSVTQYAANTTKISLGGEYRMYVCAYAIKRDVKSFYKQI